MKQIVKRPELSDTDVWILIQVGRMLLAYQWLRSHTAPVTASVGVIMFFPALYFQKVYLWAVVVLMFAAFFVATDQPHRAAQPARKPRDTGPLHL